MPRAVSPPSRTCPPAITCCACARGARHSPGTPAKRGCPCACCPHPGFRRSRSWGTARRCCWSLASAAGARAKTGNGRNACARRSAPAPSGSNMRCGAAVASCGTSICAPARSCARIGCPTLRFREHAARRDGGLGRALRECRRLAGIPARFGRAPERRNLVPRVHLPHAGRKQRMALDADPRGVCAERDGGGRALRMVGTTQDITTLKQAEESLRKLNEESKIARGRAHGRPAPCESGTAADAGTIDVGAAPTVGIGEDGGARRPRGRRRPRDQHALGRDRTAASHLREERLRLARQPTLDPEDLIGFHAMIGESSEIILRNLQRADRLIKSFKLVAVDQTTEELAASNSAPI